MTLREAVRRADLALQATQPMKLAALEKETLQRLVEHANKSLTIGHRTPRADGPGPAGRSPR